MATAVEQFGKEPVIKTKATEIKTLIHKQIINVGEDVYKRTTERQQQLFDDYLLKHESKLLDKLDERKQKALDNQRQKHYDDLKRLKKEYKELQDAALKQQTKRVEKIMNEKVVRLLEKKQLEGQQKLDEALIEAREMFDGEKKECMENLIRKLQREFDQRLKEEQNAHKDNVRKLNEDWEILLKKNNEENAKNLMVELEKQRLELDQWHAENTKKRTNELEENHQKQMAECNKKIQETETDNGKLSDEIGKLNGNLQEMKHYMKIIMETFREFIESCDGFGEGQTDFLLDKVIPQKVEDFLRS